MGEGKKNDCSKVRGWEKGLSSCDGDCVNAEKNGGPSKQRSESEFYWWQWQ